MIPAYREPTSPGQMLLCQFLEPMGISQEQFLKNLGWKNKGRLIRIINNSQRISDQIAREFSKVLGTTTELWTNLQKKWDLWYLTKQCV